jgi:microcystin-dependent protein
MPTAYTSNRKIGALDLATTPLAATNELVINQNGDILKTPLSAIEAKVFDAKTATSSPTGTEVVVIRQTDNSLRQVALSNIVPAGNITNAKVSDSAAIADTKLATISTAGKVANSATTATSSNTINAIVARDGSGNFSATGVTATTFTGTLAGNATGNAATATALATGRTISLTGDVTGTTGSFNGSANVSAATTIANNAVTTAKIADSNVTTAKIADSNVTTAKITDSNVTTAKIADSNVTTAKIAADAVDNTKLRNSAGLSVIGRSANSTGDPADIAATDDGHVLRRSGTTLAFGQIATGGITDAAVTTAKIADSNVTLAKLVTAVQQALVPAGAVQAFAMSSAPSGWLSCAGQAVSRTDFAALFAVLGTTYGVGDGSTTFNVPDLRGYFIRGWGSNIDGTTSGSFASKQADELKSHSHFYSQPSSSFVYSHNGGADALRFLNVSAQTTATGGTETRPKNIAMLYCIKF